VDQKLVQHNVDPLFPENYKTFAKWEFLIDSDVEFSKLKHLLDKNPKVLTEDPLVGLDYVKIIELIKKKSARVDGQPLHVSSGAQLP